MATDKLGLYVHIPYCRRKCNYCDFCSLPRQGEGVPNEYIERLINEISAYKRDDRIPVSTVYFGGGTPSLLLPEQMRDIMHAVREVFEIPDLAEVTFEANPGTLTEEKALAYKALGFNRVSLGLQSIHDIEMKKLGRIHDYDEFLHSYHMLRNCGFENINVDLMYGIPYQTKDSFGETLEAVTSLAPEHISCYGLMIEEGTPFYKEARDLPLPSSDEECDMYYMAAEILKAKGYSHYEISNYSRPGFESKHNLVYWNTDDYIGIGASAHSLLNGIRRSNTDNVDVYVAEEGISPAEETSLDNEDRRYEYAMLGLRLADGFCLSEYEKKFGVSFTDDKEDMLNSFSDLGLIDISDGRIRLTEKGFYVSNAILVEIL